MGSGMSVSLTIEENPDKYKSLHEQLGVAQPSPSPSSKYHEEDGFEELSFKKQHKAARIFDRQESTLEVNLNTILKGDIKNENTLSIISKALSGFIYFDSNDSQSTKKKLELIIQAMVKREYPEGHVLIKEGESGSCLYVLETGNLKVYINNNHIRDLTDGALVGELSLLYDAPRSATVVCQTPCVFWTLERDVFKKIQAISSSANQIQRARCLISSTELATLSAIDLSRLVSSLHSVQFSPGDKVFIEGNLTSQIVIIEKGEAEIFSSTIDPKLKLSNREIDQSLMIIRPLEGKRKSVNYMSPEQLSTYLDSNLTSDLVNISEDDLASFSPFSKNSYFSSENSITDVYDGCIIGIGSLRGKANLTPCWPWEENESRNSTKNNSTKQSNVDGSGKQVKFEEEDDYEEEDDNGSLHMTKSGSKSPITMIAKTELHCLIFTVEIFENLFGPAETVIKKSKANTTIELSVNKNNEFKFDCEKFNKKYILGSGSFGVVTLAEYGDNKFDEFLIQKNIPSPTLANSSSKSSKTYQFALKSLSKVTIIETLQLRHVLDERKILSSLNSPFILKLYGTYQTRDELVMVTESLNCGDLWSIIYETQPFASRHGIPFPLCSFYAANLVLGLSHIHENGIIYRDLKPENIMIDEKGYLRIIDFGFSKKVPYTKIDPNTGEIKVYPKTYTLCGTPEYLAPELIFNLGHDSSVDIWALGVIIYEMLMSVTPFAPKRPENVTELFTNIALVKKNGLMLSTRIDQHCNSNLPKNLITKLLKAEPNLRLGIVNGSTRKILEHEFFKFLDIPAIYNRTFQPEYIPINHSKNMDSNQALNNNYLPLTKLSQVKVYEGDQSIFNDF